MDLPRIWLHMGNTHLSREQFRPIRNQFPLTKPTGGIWVSPLTYGEKYYSDWERFYDSVWGSNNVEEGTLVTLDKNAKIYTINSKEDISRLIEEVGEAENPFPSLTTFSSLKQIDFEKMVGIYDALYLTKKGQMNTRLSFNDEGLNLQGWDCESCVILNYDVIQRQTCIKLGKPSERKHDTDTSQFISFSEYLELVKS